MLQVYKSTQKPTNKQNERDELECQRKKIQGSSQQLKNSIKIGQYRSKYISLRPGLISIQNILVTVHYVSMYASDIQFTATVQQCKIDSRN